MTDLPDPTRFAERDWQTTADGTVRFALVGLGWWTVDEAVPAIAETDLCETTVLVSSSAEKAERVADRVDTATHGITYDQFHDGVAADAYDAVYICTPNAFHLDYARTAAELGKDVLTEKPMEATEERAAEMVAACDAHDVTLVVGYRMQAEPAVRRARELVREGVVGDPCYVHGTFTQRLLDMIPDRDQWRLNPDLSGYGTSVMDLGIYPINTARFVLDADPVSVTATMHSDHEAFADVPDEHASFTVQYEGGVHAVGTASQNAQPRSHFEVVGTEGSVRIDPAFALESSLSVTIGDSTLTYDAPQVNQMTELFDYAAHGMLVEDAAYPDGRHGLVDLATIAAVHGAAERDERVAVGAQTVGGR